MKIILKNNKGYTLLFSVLVAAVVLAVGISILSISKKEFLLSSSARESMSAFYSADTGIECSVYNDQSGDIFNSSQGNIICNNTSVAITSSTNDAGDRLYIFSIPMNDKSACAVVQVRKYTKRDTTINTDVPMTEVFSRGYNIGWLDSNKTCDQVSPRRVERAIIYTY